MQAAIAAGGLLGAVVAPRLQRRMPLRTLVTALATLAPIVAGLLVQHVGGAWAVGAFAATMAVAVALGLHAGLAATGTRSRLTQRVCSVIMIT